MKDWTGNNKFTYTMMGASNHTDKDRETNDFYATPPRAIDDLFSQEPFSQEIWEPACGAGHLANRMIELGKTVLATDLIDRGCGATADFLAQQDGWRGDIITNPPYKYGLEFVQKSTELVEVGAKVAMFLKLTFLESEKRAKFFKKNPPKTVYVYSKRIACAMNGEFEKYNASAICHAWFVWEKGFTGDPIIKWI